MDSILRYSPLLDLHLLETIFVLLCKSTEASHECPQINKLGEWPTKKAVSVETQCSECQYLQMHGSILTPILPEMTFIFLTNDNRVKDIRERL